MTTPIYQAPAGGEDDPNAWFRHARCVDVDTEVFFPGQGESTEPARAICRQCPVQQECLDYALAERITHGIFGGTSERERRRLRSGRLKTLRCLECGKPFQVTPTSGGSMRKTCSAPCQTNRRRKQQYDRMGRRSIFG